MTIMIRAPPPPPRQTRTAILFPSAFPKMHPTEYYQVLRGGQAGGWAENSERKHLEHGELKNKNIFTAAEFFRLFNRPVCLVTS